jgi:hypothetical protein
MMRWTLEAMGFNIQIMPLPEVYLAIQQGAVAGQENPIDTIYSNKFYEVAPNVTLTNHVYSPIPLTIGEDLAEAVAGRPAGGVEAARIAAKFSRNDLRQRRQPAGGDGRQGRQGQRRPDVARSAPRCNPSTPRPRRSTAPTSMRS